MANRIHFAQTAKLRLKVCPPQHLCKSETDVRRVLNTRRKTDATLNPPPSYEQLLSKSRGSKSLIGRLRRCHSEDKLEQPKPPEVIEERKRAPRGIAPVDDLPSRDEDVPEQKRFNPNAGFDAFYDSCCFSVPAENWGNWPMAPKRVGHRLFVCHRLIGINACRIRFS